MKKFLGFTLMLFTAFLLVACGTNEYTVTFDSNGGSEVASVVVEEGSKVDEPSEPTRLGYDFIEWQLDGDKFDFDTVITADRKSTRLNSSHVRISYAVFCLKKKK